jgi:hypothetical protein
MATAPVRGRHTQLVEQRPIPSPRVRAGNRGFQLNKCLENRLRHAGAPLEHPIAQMSKNQQERHADEGHQEGAESSCTGRNADRYDAAIVGA